MREVSYKPIGMIRSPFKEPKGTPIQASAASGIEGTVEVFPKFADGLKDLEGFSHIILIYHFHLVNKASLEVKPFMDEQSRGVFATRGPVDRIPLASLLCALSKLRGTYFTLKMLMLWTVLLF